MNSKMTWVLGLGLLGMAGFSRADTIVFPSGGQIQGVILKDVEGSLLIHLKHGIVTVPKAEVASITKDDEAVLRGHARLAPWQACLRVLVARPWGPDLRPEPAMIIDSGPFKNVPYITDRSGNREFSIYGDPDEPAGLEIGLSKELAQNPDARKEAVLALKPLLGDPKDQETLGSMDLAKKGKSDRQGLVFEINEDTNAKGDATWWISIYNPQALDKIRLSDEETKKLSAGSSGAGSGPGQTTSSGGGSSPSGSGTTTTSSGQPGTFGFSPGAQSGGSTSSPPNNSRRNYRGGNYGHYWHTMHPKPAPVKGTGK
jgi:hypothetical protein